MEFEAVIGLEVHCQLSTETKIFCACRARLSEGTDSGALASNVHVCPICAGHPGTLPVLNRKVVEYAIKAGLATGCEIRQRNVFARKNYFYPDLPRGYQISQFEKPICEKGWLEIETGSDLKRKIGIHRIHMEEDAGKNVHMAGYSLVNLNRAGVPLIEIVSEPDLRSSEEAGAYLRSLHAIVTALEICDGNMQNGNFRCDANVSVRLRGAQKLGTRVEIKNVNSFRFIEKSIDFEIARQIEVVKAGGRVIQETRLYDSARNATASMRSKEEAEDYRYFPDPDLIDVQISAAQIDVLRQALPELPAQKKDRYIREFGLSSLDASVLTGSMAFARFFEATLAELQDPGGTAKPTANLMTGEVIRLLNEDTVELGQAKLTPSHLAEILRLVCAQAISSTGAKTAIAEVWKTGDPVAKIVERAGLRQVSDLGALAPVVDQVLAEFPAQVAELKSGKEKVIGFLVGQVMKRSGGKANPQMLQELIKKRLSS
ncbi:Asp-tRNA(Asn)/Glu-tRNA(Gln) amidotransferase subunit GatB [Bdellovibrionota bacterium FG-1]